MNLTILFLFLFALIAPHLSSAQDKETKAIKFANYWANQAKQQRFLKNRQRAILRKRQAKLRSRSYIPPWFSYKTADENGKRNLDVEDMQLWASIDLNKDGKLTLSEFERFSRSPHAQAFIRQMKQHEAVENWLADVTAEAYKKREKKLAAINAARRQAYLKQVYIARAQAKRRAIARRNQAIYAARQRQNYLAQLGVDPYMQAQYQQAMRRGGKSEL